MSERINKIKSDIAKIEASMKVYSKKNDATSKKIVQSFKVKLDSFEKELNKAEKEEKSALKKIQIKNASKKVADLKKLVSSKKYAIYKGAGVDLEKDAKVSALPYGKRKAKTTGNTYYEYRANRVDIKPKKYPKLEHGGELSKDDFIKNSIVYDNGGKSLDRYTVYTPDGSVYGMSELGGGFNQYLGEENEVPKGRHLGKKLKYVPKEIESAILSRMEYANGGYMAKGGEVENLQKELRKLQRELNSSRLYTYMEGDTSEAEMARQKERAEKMARFNEVLELLRKEDAKYAKGGGIDGQKIAKPSGWRWKNEAVEDGIINDNQLYKTPSERARKEFPDYVYFEDRPTKSDKNPSKKYISLETGGEMEDSESEIDEKVEKYIDRLKNGEKVKRYFHVRGKSNPKYYETILPNTSEKGMYKRYESVSNSSIGTLQNEYLTEDDLREYFKKTIVEISKHKGTYEHGGYMAKGGKVRSPKEFNKLIEEKERIVKNLSSKEVAEMWNKNVGKMSQITVEEASKPNMKMYLSNLLVEKELTEDEYNKYFEHGGYMANGGEIGKSFSINEMKEYLDEKFEYSFRFGLYPIKEGTIFNPDYDSEIIKGRTLNGLSDYDLNDKKISFPNYKRDHQINFSIHQGEENTYFNFLLMSVDGNEYYSGTFGFKDRGDVESEYITRFIAFLMEQYGLPFKVNHSVYEHGGYMADGGGIDEIDMNEVESSAIFYTDDTKWTPKPTIKKFVDEIEEYEKLKKMLDNKEITPSKIIGTGFKSQYARPLAYRYLNEKILVAKRAIEILKERGHTYANGGELHRTEQ